MTGGRKIVRDRDARKSSRLSYQVWCIGTCLVRAYLSIELDHRVRRTWRWLTSNTLTLSNTTLKCIYRQPHLAADKKNQAN